MGAAATRALALAAVPIAVTPVPHMCYICATHMVGPMSGCMHISSRHEKKACTKGEGEVRVR